jgi:L-ascorbate metabolism protein UlaG (beta-lactamase superfamily)
MISLPSLRRTILCALVLLGSAAAGACRVSPTHGPRPGGACDGCADRVSVKYLGSGGVLLRHGGDAILTGPLFSNPDALQVLGLAPLRSDTAVIDRRMAAIFRDTGGIAAVLVGHSHYDHLLDVPYVAEKYVPGVPIYGNHTMAFILASWPGRDRLRVVDSVAGDSTVEGRWIYPKAEGPRATGTRADSTVRFMAIRTVHPAHVILAGVPIHYYRRDLPGPALEIPSNAWDWAEGPLFAFVIDFLDDAGRVVFRAHYSDAPAWGANGMPPRSLQGFDLALLCVGGSNTVQQDDSIPLALLDRIHPRAAFLIHWENFFEPQTDHPRALFNLDVPAYVARVSRRVDPSRVVLPNPGDVAAYPAAPHLSPAPTSR